MYQIKHHITYVIGDTKTVSFNRILLMTYPSMQPWIYTPYGANLSCLENNYLGQLILETLYRYVRSTNPFINNDTDLMRKQTVFSRSFFKY